MPAAIEIVQQVIEAWKRRDVDAVLELLDEDVVYHYHVGSRPLVGKVIVRRFLEKFGAGQHEIRWRIVNHAQNGDVLLVEGVDDYLDAEGVRHRTPYMGAFEVRDGRIHAWRDYLDLQVAERIRSDDDLPGWLAALL